MQFSPATIARGKQLRSVAIATFIVAFVGRILLVEPMTGEPVDPGNAGIVSALQAVGAIAGLVWLLAGFFAAEPKERRLRGFMFAGMLTAGLAFAPLHFGLVDETAGITIALAGGSIGFFIVLLALMRPVSAVAGTLSSLVMLLLGGYAFSAGQPLIGGAIAIVFAIVSVFVMVRRVNAADRQE